MFRKQSKVVVEDACQSGPAPACVKRAITRLLSLTPPEHLAGLSAVVLMEARTASRATRKAKVRRQGKTVSLDKSFALYHRQDKSQGAWVEVFVDNVLLYWPLAALRVPFIADIALSEILFHEIGHHIHRSKHLGSRGSEAMAERWQKDLTKHYFWRSYWYAMPVFYLVSLCHKVTIRLGERVKREKGLV